jgi:hypothetical protein
LLRTDVNLDRLAARRGGLKRCQQQIELLGPGDERSYRLALLLFAVRAFQPMEHLVTHVDARPRLVLAQQRNRIRKRDDDAPIAQVELGLNGRLKKVFSCLPKPPAPVLGSRRWPAQSRRVFSGGGTA